MAQSTNEQLVVEKALFEFREKLYEFVWDEENMLEVAKMKSMVQHFNTEILEDEDVLRVAYSNEK
jgi:recombination DNA repair RAD52 pathway protein